MDIATGAIGSILSKLADLLTAEYNLQSGVKDQIESLTKELKSAQAFLQDIDKVPPDQLDEQVKLYVCQVREASYDMEDILDTFFVHVTGPKPTINNKTNKKLINRLQEKMASFFRKTAARHGIARAIDDVMKCLQEATERRGRYTVDNIVTKPSPSLDVDPRLAAMCKQVKHLIGIDKSRDQLTSLLSLSSQGDTEISDMKLKVVSVVGVGGLGKTTLAKAVYDNLKAQFCCCAFVPVGRNPDMKKVLRDLLIDLDKEKYMYSNFILTLDERQTINELQDFLQKKRYLIVVDDVWDIKSWRTINLALVENDNESRVIITTRNSEVAIGQCYRLQPLSDYNSKKLLYTRLFNGEYSHQYSLCQKVAKVADKILKKCGGVPLAIITMASLLVGKSMEEWFDACDSRFHDKGKEKTGDTMWILSLSYYDLPSHLKTCLLYLSIFPEDHLIRKDQLIWMWIAEGFILEKQGTRLFEIGERYYNELINRSLIQPVDHGYDGMFEEGCRVHDMIFDLICSLSCEANFATTLDNDEETLLGSNARRLVLQNRAVDYQNNRTENTMRARSFIAFGCRFIPRLQLQSIKLLRVLHIEGSHNVGRFHEHIGDLHNLRYLGMHGCAYGLNLPKEIGALKFLQVLYLEHQDRGVLPSNMGMLTQLVCLHAPGMILPGGIIKDMTSLQELRIAMPPENDDRSRSQFVNDLGSLSELRVLEIRSTTQMDRRTRLDLVTSVGRLHKLQHLDLQNITFYDEAAWHGGLPSCIDPSRLPNLSHLSLQAYSLDHQGLKILGGLPELRHLCLRTAERATLTGTAAHGYFQKLRSCAFVWSMVQFVGNEEDPSVSFTIWVYNYDAPTFGSRRREQDSCKVAWAVMPNLEALCFYVNVRELTACNNGGCHNLGLEHLTSLHKVTVRFDTWSADADVVEIEEAVLRHAIRVHPNRPTLQIQYM